MPATRQPLSPCSIHVTLPLLALHGDCERRQRNSTIGEFGAAKSRGVAPMDLSSKNRVEDAAPSPPMLPCAPCSVPSTAQVHHTWHVCCCGRSRWRHTLESRFPRTHKRLAETLEVQRATAGPMTTRPTSAASAPNSNGTMARLLSSHFPQRRLPSTLEYLQPVKSKVLPR